MDDEPRSAVYVIRWEILVMAVSLILIAVLVLTIPYDFSDRLIKEREALQQKELNVNGTVNATNITQP